MKLISLHKMTRRQVLAATATALPAVSLLASARAAFPATAFSVAGHAAYSFFNPTEASFIEAACERLIPADAAGPGAREVGVPEYMDRHLGAGWGSGAMLYRVGQWQPGTPPERRQTSTPAELFRSAVSAIHCDLSKRGVSFAELPSAAQDTYLASLAADLPLPGIATAAFFDLLLLMTAEGFFADARAATHRDRLVWPLRGFPGAFASASPFGGSTWR